MYESYLKRFRQKKNSIYFLIKYILWTPKDASSSSILPNSIQHISLQNNSLGKLTQQIKEFIVAGVKPRLIVSFSVMYGLCLLINRAQYAPSIFFQDYRLRKLQKNSSFSNRLKTRFFTAYHFFIPVLVSGFKWCTVLNRDC